MPTPANTINESSASGLMNWDGTSVASTTALTQYNVLTGASANTVNNVAPGASGTVLTSNGVSAQPSFQTAPSSVFPWTVVSGTSQSCLVTNGYIASNAAGVSMYLPATAAVGAEVRFANILSGFTIVPSAGQTISFLTQSAYPPQFFTTTVANAAFDLVCTNANTSWNVVNNEGAFSVNLSSFTNIFTTFQTGYNLGYLDKNGQAWISGDSTYGQTGNLTTTSCSSPVSVVGGFSFDQLVGCVYQCLALDSSGHAWSWGNNTDGQLGNNTRTSASSPVSVVGGFSFISATLSNATNLSGAHGCGLTALGTAWTWGYGSSGELGNLTTSSISSPVSVVGNFSFSYIGAGNACSYGIQSGVIWGWGSNQSGQMGNQTTGASYSSPVSVVGGISFVQVVGAAQYALGLDGSGHCWGWGANGVGQLGNQTTTAVSSPVSVVGNFSFVSIMATYQMSYGLLSNGSVWAWGQGSFGALGNNTISSASSPVSVVGGIFFNQLAYGSGGRANSMSAQQFNNNLNGTIWSWGDNNTGQLGNNTVTSYSSPILIV